MRRENEVLVRERERLMAMSVDLRWDDLSRNGLHRRRYARLDINNAVSLRCIND